MKNVMTKAKNISKAIFVCTSLLISLPVLATPADSYQTNVISITEQKLMPEYWIKKLNNPDQVLMSGAQISAVNQAQFNRADYLIEPLSYPDKLSKAAISQLINNASQVPQSERFYPDGRQLTADDFSKYQAQIGLENLAEQNAITFALVTRRTSLRTFPTLDRVLNKGMDIDLDRFQESAVFPGEALAIFHVSADGQWYFVQNYHYQAWVQAKDIALATREQVAEFALAKDKLLVTGAKVSTNFNPENAQTSEIQLDMGTTLPLLSHSKLNGFALKGQNPYASHIVQFPTRDENGKLKVEAALIARSADVSIGHIAMTPANIIEQGFKFLGERYGWGHDYNARDCTGFVGEIHKSFGLLLPRNSGQQGKDDIGINTRFDKTTNIADKTDALKQLEVGDLIYLPGHVAMFLGYDNGEPYIIHSVKGLSYINSQGEKITGTLNGVSITPLLPFESYIRGMYNIKRLR